MRTLIITSLILLSPLCIIAQPADSSAWQVRERFDAFADAFQNADANVLAPMLTDRYVHTGPTGNVSDKESWLSWIRSRRAEIEAGGFRFDSYEMLDVSIQVYGDAAIVTGLNEAEGVRLGEPFIHNIRFTNVWVRVDGVWKRAAFHDSRKELIIND